MVRICCVTGCKNVWGPNCDISFFGFPLKNEHLLDRCKQVIPTRYKITKHTTICSDHFSNASYTYKSSKRWINKNATALQYQKTKLDKSAGTSGKSLVAQPCIGEHLRENCEDLRDITSIVDNNYNFSFNKQQESSPIKTVALTSKETFGFDRATQTSPVSAEVQKHVGTQISPRQLPPSKTEEQLRKKIKLLTSRLHRRESKILTITELLSDFTKNGKLTEDLEEIFFNKFSGLNMELFRYEIANTKRSKLRSEYSDKVKEFALTIYFYLLKAYECIRTALHLPHKGILRKWVGKLFREAGFLLCVFNVMRAEGEKN